MSLMNLSVRSFHAAGNMHAMAAVIVCGMLTVLPGCKIPSLRPPEAARELPEAFNVATGTDNSATLSIDEFFQDPILTGLIIQGLAGNQELKILAEDIQIANNEVLKRRGAYLPFVSLGIARADLRKISDLTLEGASLNDDPYFGGTKFLPNPLPDFMTAANVSWQIDIWRQLRNSRDAAALRVLGSTEGRTYIVTRLVAEIAENYYTLMALDKRMENLDNNIMLMEQSLEVAKAKKEAARGTELAVQRFLAEVRKNYSEKLIISQDIIEAENRINFLVGRFPQPVERKSDEFFDLKLHALSAGVPSELLLNRPDIRRAEYELQASGLDIKVARANFYPRLVLTAGVGWDAFNPKYLFMTPQSLVYNVAGDLVAPLINKKAIQADYMTANARQLQALYNYQRVVLNACTEVINRISKVENYTKSIEIKKQQLESLEASVEAASNLFQAARAEYIDVLFAQRDLRDARMVYIDTKNEQLSAIVNTYQALGGGQVALQLLDPMFTPIESLTPIPMAPTEDAPVLNPPTPDEGSEEE
jgi:outer membrane protein, multidrug efflux system